jgi:hypothetical protein
MDLNKFVFILILNFWFSSLICKESKFLFDDFNYKSVKVYQNIDSLGSLFSRNIWKTDKGDSSLKAWFKWNSGDKEFSPGCEIKLASDGFIMNMKKGILLNEALMPMMISSFQLKYGTYASMCKFSEFDDEDKITQAYWLTSPLSFTFHSKGARIQYRDEIDFEWNNWWVDNNAYLMSVGCNMRNYRRPSQMNLNCVLRDSLGNTTNLKQCIIPFTGKPAITDRWGLCIFVIDSIKNCTKFGIYFPDDGKGYDIWVGDNFDWGHYFTIYNYSVYHPQIVNYSMGSTKPDMHGDCPFEVDWFYYNERTDIDYDEILDIVNGFKSQKIDRIYNGNIFFNEIEKPDSKDIFYFQGDTIIEAENNYKWILQSECKRWYGHYDMKEMKYRFHNKSGYWEEWNNIFTSQPELKAATYQDSLEIFASFSEYWSKYEDSARIKISVKSNESKSYKIIHDVQIFPNPFKEYSCISYSLSEESNIKIRIADMIGKVVYSENQFKKSGRYTLDLSNFNLSFGFYIFMIYADNQIETINFLRR